LANTIVDLGGGGPKSIMVLEISTQQQKKS
jgi:hypothetical protein